MLELGKDTLDIHKEIVEYTMNKLPNIQIYGVGQIMSSVINSLKTSPPNNAGVSSFQNSQEAASFLKNELKTGDLIYLKGSRGIALETIEFRISVGANHYSSFFPNHNN
jgi:UDP-N-acetylmuramyl pentapeptide synthase